MSTLNSSRKQIKSTDKPYPKLMCVGDGSMIAMFSEKHHCCIVYTDGHHINKLGSMVTEMKMDSWVDYYGSVTLNSEAM